MSYSMITRVAGVKMNNDDGTRRQDILGGLYDDYWTEDLEDEIELELRPEPENKFDSNAVAVWCVSPEDSAGKIGYIPRESSEFVAEQIASGKLLKMELDTMGCAGQKAEVYLKLKLVLAGQDDSPESHDFVEDTEGRIYEIDD